MKFGVGQSVPRVEDKRLLTGGGRYTDDHVMEGMAAAFFLRSPHAHARIKSINAERARLSPGVVSIFTSADVACVYRKLDSAVLMVKTTENWV